MQIKSSTFYKPEALNNNTYLHTENSIICLYMNQFFWLLFPFTRKNIVSIFLLFIGVPANK